MEGFELDEKEILSKNIDLNESASVVDKDQLIVNRTHHKRFEALPK